MAFSSRHDRARFHSIQHGRILHDHPGVAFFPRRGVRRACPQKQHPSQHHHWLYYYKEKRFGRGPPKKTHRMTIAHTNTRPWPETHWTRTRMDFSARIWMKGTKTTTRTQLLSTTVLSFNKSKKQTQDEAVPLVHRSCRDNLLVTRVVHAYRWSRTAYVVLVVYDTTTIPHLFAVFYKVATQLVFFPLGS